VGFGDVSADNFHPKVSSIVQKDGTVHIYPIDQQGIERKWRYARQSVESIAPHLKVKLTRNKAEIIIGKDFGAYKTVWIDKKYDASEYGTKLLKKILPDCNFDFPKSLHTVYDCIYAVIGRNKEALVLDYFAGSGTTGHAVLELNKEDNGSRQFILCTNNENGIASDVAYPRIKNVINGYSNVNGIPANIRYFKTDFVSKEHSDDQTRAELVARSKDMLCLREDAFEPVLKNNGYQLFKGVKSFCAIVFDPEKIEKFKQEIRKLNINKPLNIYIFSLSNDTYSSDFIDLGVVYTVRPIPESILEVYRRIASMRSINE
jgi:adenine-specific DNA-methyltransferase